MFRVDPAFKSIPIIAHIRGIRVEDYRFLRVTRCQPIWIVNRVDDEWAEYLFDDLLSAISATGETWSPLFKLHAVLPHHMSSSKDLTMVTVKSVYECRRGVRKDRRFEVVTKDGSLSFDEHGRRARKTLRTALLWIA